MEDDTVLSESEYNPTSSSTLHPLEMAHIIAKVFTYLGSKTLKEVRGVCKLWKHEGAKELLRKSFVRFSPNFQLDYEALGRLVSTTGTLPFLNLRLSSRDIITLNDTNLFERVRELKYEGDSTALLSDLLLSSLPNLEILDTKSLNLLQLEHQDQAWCQEQGQGGKTNFENLLIKLESLKEIRLNFFLTPSILINLLGHQSQSKSFSIKALKILGSDIQEINQLFQQQSNNRANSSSSMQYDNSSTRHQLLSLWTISRLELNYLDPNGHNNNNSTLNLEATRGLLHIFSGSLQHLRINVSMTNQGGRHGQRVTPRGDGEDDPISVLLPPSLKKLESLELKTFTTVQNAGVPWHLIIFPALQLQSLKKLTVGGAGPLWVTYLALLKCGSLEELNIHHNSCTLSALVNKTITPNLKVLRMNVNLCDPTSLTTLRNMFRDMSSVESLELHLNFNEQIQMDEIFNDSSQASISNLQNLKKLAIRSWCRKNFRFSDLTLDSVLMGLNKLQCLDVEGHNFSKEAVTKLKETLSQNAFIRVDNIQRIRSDPFFLSWPNLTYYTS